MADYLDRIRRLSALLFVISVVLVFGLIHAPSAPPADLAPVHALLLSALVTGVVVYRFPFRRYHPNWFLVVGILGTAMIATLIRFSGAQRSVFFPLFVFVVVASGAYYTRLPLVFITLVAAAGSFTYLLYSPATLQDVLGSLFQVAILAVSAFLCHAIFRGLERSTEESQHYAALLGVLHEIDSLALANARPADVAAAALRALHGVLDFELGGVAAIQPDGATTAWIALDGQPDPAPLPAHLDERQRLWLTETRRGPLRLSDQTAERVVGGRSCLVQGLIIAEIPTGLLAVARPAPVEWNKRERDTVARVGSRLAMALERGVWAEQAARAEAQQALAKMKEEFVSHVGHELRQPLGVIRGGVELVKAGRLTGADADAMLEHVLVAGKHLDDVVESLMQLAEADRAGWVLERQATDLLVLVREAIAALDGTERVQVVAPAELAPLVLDRVRVKQVLINLIGNALKYSPDGKPVRVVCDETEAGARIVVEDEGVGIAREALPRIFERFYRAPNRLAGGIPGTGLGLAITKQLVEAHGGRVWVDSPGVGRGSTFGVELPRGSPTGPAVKT